MDTIQTIDKLKEVFVPVAEKIGQGVEFGWEIVVKQQFAYGIIGLVVAVFGIIIIFISYKINQRVVDYDKGIPLVIGGIIGFSMTILGTIEGILHLLNPEYYAIEFFMDLVK